MTPIEAPRAFVLKELSHRWRYRSQSDKAMADAPIIVVHRADYDWPKPGEVRLPFPVVLFETQAIVSDDPGALDRWFIVAADLPMDDGSRDRVLVFTAFIEREAEPGRFFRLPYGVELGADLSWIAPSRVYPDDKYDYPEDPAIERQWSNVLASIGIGCIVLATNHPGAMRAVPASQRGLSVAKRRMPHRGWLYRIVEIPPTHKPSGIDLGGTHASPCWHIRRGHWRLLADGRRVWVRSCEVGSDEHGGVVKDYEVIAA